MEVAETTRKSRREAGNRDRGSRPKHGATASATLRLAIVGMRCEDCAARIQDGILHHDGVLAAEVRLASASVRIVFDPRRTNPRSIMELVMRVRAGCPPVYRAVPMPEPRWSAPTPSPP